MLTVALAALLATVPQTSTAAQPKLEGQACTARELIGTWQIASKPSTPGITTALKHVTPTHFFVVRLGAKNVAQSGHGGPYSVANGTYTETVEHGFGEAFEKFPGVSVSFQCRLNGDMLHIVGEYQGHKMNEQWRRVSGKSAHP